MILPGHIASAYLASRATGADLRGALAASMFPDFVDKPIRWLLRLTPNDRIPAHTLLFWAATTILARLLAGPRLAKGWAVGYGAHLLGDEINAHLNPGRIYFWWPFRRYTMHIGPTGLGSSLNDFSARSLAVEGATCLLAGAIWFRGAKHNDARRGYHRQKT